MADRYQQLINTPVGKILSKQVGLPSPIPLDRGKPGSNVADWLNLPWGHPNEIVLTGYHTAAEDSLKRLGPMKGVGLGNDVFLNVLGLMSTGARTNIPFPA